LIDPFAEARFPEGAWLSMLRPTPSWMVTDSILSVRHVGATDENEIIPCLKYEHLLLCLGRGSSRVMNA
jgi:hypothetical protein